MGSGHRLVKCAGDAPHLHVFGRGPWAGKRGRLLLILQAKASGCWGRGELSGAGHGAAATRFPRPPMAAWLSCRLGSGGTGLAGGSEQAAARHAWETRSGHRLSVLHHLSTGLGLQHQHPVWKAMLGWGPQVRRAEECLAQQEQLCLCP